MRTCTDLNACGTTNDKPSETATLPALDFNFYKSNVEPIMNRKCSMLGCHGTESGRALRLYSRGRLRLANENYIEGRGDCLRAVDATTPSEQCIGSIHCVCGWSSHTSAEWQRNFDSARGFGLDTQGNPIPPERVDESDLIAQAIVGGKAHAGIHLFRSGDADHDTLRQWLSGTTQPSCNTIN
jgi:hypothetical protein